MAAQGLAGLVPYGERLGKGSYGEVFKCYVPQDINWDSPWYEYRGQKFAVKKMKKSKRYIELQNSELKARSVLPICNGILRHYGEAEDKEYIYIVMEYLRHGDLHTLGRQVRVNPDPYGVIRHIMYTLLEGLVRLHAEGLVHQDIKPQNILVRDPNTYRCAISDFGSLYVMNSDPAQTWLKTTYHYAAPEQAKSALLNLPDYGDPKSDVWSLAMSIVIITRGAEYFDVTEKKEVIFNGIVDGSAVDDLRRESIIFKDVIVADLFLGMLAQDPNDRFSAAEAFSHPFIQYQEFTTPLNRFKPFKPLKRNSKGKGAIPPPKKIKGIPDPVIASSSDSKIHGAMGLRGTVGQTGGKIAPILGPRITNMQTSTNREQGHEGVSRRPMSARPSGGGERALPLASTNSTAFYGNLHLNDRSANKRVSKAPNPDRPASARPASARHITRAVGSDKQVKPPLATPLKGLKHLSIHASDDTTAQHERRRRRREDKGPPLSHTKQFEKINEGDGRHNTGKSRAAATPSRSDSITQNQVRERVNRTTEAKTYIVHGRKIKVKEDGTKVVVR